MACFQKDGDKTKITIPKFEQKDKYTVYEIQLEVGDVKWMVSHRYSDFVQLHDVLVSGHSVARDLLPPKRVLGNREPSFIEKRRHGLEIYLFTVLRFLQKTMPKELIEFLDFQQYDILFLLQNFAEKCFAQDEELLLTKKNTLSTLELHAISERLKQPCPAFGPLDQKQDFSHVLDYCSKLTELTVVGNNNFFQRSNIVPNLLPFDFNAFKSLEKLILNRVNCDMILGLGELRTTLKTLEIHNVELTFISQFLLCDEIHKDEVEMNEHYAFKNINKADFSGNQLVDIHKSVQLLPNVETLSFESNKIEDIQFLNSLIKLKYLNLSCNHFRSTKNLELKLCKIVYLDLSQNFISSLKEFSKLYSLETLDVSSNKITDIAEVRHIANLPCLENLNLTGNLVSVVVDYRIKVLQLFGNRASEICLDNEKPNQKELDKVAVLQAITSAREGRMIGQHCEVPRPVLGGRNNVVLRLEGLAEQDEIPPPSPANTSVDSPPAQYLTSSYRRYAGEQEVRKNPATLVEKRVNEK